MRIEPGFGSGRGRGFDLQDFRARFSGQRSEIPAQRRGVRVQGLLEILKKLGPGRLAAMGAVTVALIGFFAFVIMRFSQPDMAALFTDLDVKDSAAIVKSL